MENTSNMVMDKSEYVQKLTNMLNDKDVYEKMKGNPTKRLQNEMSSLLRRYKECEHLSKKQYR